jgi:lysophospholipase L1-like esterase
MRWITAMALLAGPCFVHAAGVKTVVIGDSLSAEYDPIVSIPGFGSTATAYADVTTNDWEAFSWVELCADLRSGQFDLGAHRAFPNVWGEVLPLDPRASGYEYNWAIPGVTAHDFAAVVTATPFSNLAYHQIQQAIRGDLEDVGRAVVFLGGNEFRGNFGGIYDGTADTNAIINTLVADVRTVLEFVLDANPSLQVCLVNVPDTAATPNKQEAHPDPVLRQRVTEATRVANVKLAALAASNGVAFADVFTQTTNLIAGVPHYFGAVNMVYAKHPDNHPRYEFTRDGLHPNNPGQIEVLRAIIAAFNARYAAGIPPITDAEALGVLGLSNDIPFYEWARDAGVTATNFVDDPDADGVVNLIEYALGGDPARGDRAELPWSWETSNGVTALTWQPDPARARHVRVAAWASSNLTTWAPVATNLVLPGSNGSWRVEAPATGRGYFRLRVETMAP